jgi:hypothetical protein
MPLGKQTDPSPRNIGFGAELSWNCWPGDDLWQVGALAQAQWSLEERGRFALAAQGVIAGFGAEAGLAYTGGDDEFAGLGAHGGLFLSAAVVWMALRFTFGVDGIYADALMGAKYPIRREGDLITITSGRPVRFEGLAVQAPLCTVDDTGT